MKSPPIIENEIIEGEEGEQVEPGIDDARFEIHVGEEGAAIGQGPEDAKLTIVDLRTAAKDDDQRDDPAKRVGETGGKFADPEYLHGCALHPEEHGRFFPEGFKVDVYPRIVMHLYHFPRGLGKIDLIPVEEVHAAQEGNEEQGAEQGDRVLEGVRQHDGHAVAFLEPRSLQPRGEAA